jgi:hypothetical protein
MARVRRGAWRSAANAGIGTREAFASRLSAVSGLRYFKRVDEANHELGGEATYFLEVDEDGDAVRQVELYPNGKVLRYSAAHQQDDWGALCVMVLDANDDWAPYVISREEFERVWQATTPLV